MSDNRTNERVEAAAEAMDKNFNPDKYPVMAAMFRDYAAVGIEAADAVVQEPTQYREWKREHRDRTPADLVQWAKEANALVARGEGWIAHENYRRAVVPSNLIETLSTDAEKGCCDRHIKIIKELTTRENDRREALNNQRREYRRLLAKCRTADAVVTEEMIAETILKALVFTNENSEAWADGLARDIAALFRGGAK